MLLTDCEDDRGQRLVGELGGRFRNLYCGEGRTGRCNLVTRGAGDLPLGIGDVLVRHMELGGLRFHSVRVLAAKSAR